MMKKLNNKKSRKSNYYKIIIVFIVAFLIFIVINIFLIFEKKYSVFIVSAKDTIKSEATQYIKKEKKLQDNNINIKEIIKENTKDMIKADLYTIEEDLEFSTRYIESDKIAKGTIQVLQEGVDGTQIITVKRTYKNEELIKEEIVGSQIIQGMVEKIVQVGTGPSYLKAKISIGDTLYVTSSLLEIRQQADINSEKITTIKKDDSVTLIGISGEWYNIKYDNRIGWAKANCLTNKNIETQEFNNDKVYTKAQLLNRLNFNIQLNKVSGFSLSQFEEILKEDSNDTKKILKENAKYFYYAEKQYGVNGVFLIAVAIHESNWGTSDISKNKNNLFGYGAYDRSPGISAYNFNSYEESIDLVARVFVKYYLNPSGTIIYNNETASGKYYNGATLSGVNVKYATDNNWSNAVYKWMQYLYNKLEN